MTTLTLPIVGATSPGDVVRVQLAKAGLTRLVYLAAMIQQEYLYVPKHERLRIEQLRKLKEWPAQDDRCFQFTVTETFSEEILAEALRDTAEELVHEPAEIPPNPTHRRQTNPTSHNPSPRSNSERIDLVKLEYVLGFGFKSHELGEALGVSSRSVSNWKRTRKAGLEQVFSRSPVGTAKRLTALHAVFSTLTERGLSPAEAHAWWLYLNPLLGEERPRVRFEAGDYAVVLEAARQVISE